MILGVFIEFFEVKIVITDIYRYFTDNYQYFTDICRYFSDIFSEILAHARVRKSLEISSKYWEFSIFR